MIIYLKKGSSIDMQKVEFNRFLKFRYISALFLFFNFYWLILSLSSIKLSIVFPIVILISFIPEIIEQTQKYWNPTNILKLTKFTFFYNSLLIYLQLFLFF